MHRSRLSTLLIDVPSHRASDAAAFWSAALGVPANPVPGEAQFTSLPGAFPGLVTAIQAVDDEPRYHVDIETDDVVAETARLVALGPPRWITSYGPVSRPLAEIRSAGGRRGERRTRCREAFCVLTKTDRLEDANG